MSWFLNHIQEIGLLVVTGLHLVPDSKGIGVVQTVITSIFSSLMQKKGE